MYPRVDFWDIKFQDLRVVETKEGETEQGGLMCGPKAAFLIRRTSTDILDHGNYS